LSQITRAHVHEMLDGIIDRGAPIRANRVFAQFRKMCRWALSREIIDRNPCEGLTSPSVETRRDRVLNDEEIKLAWNAFAVVGWPFGPIGKLLLLIGQRRNEVAGMRWSEVDLIARTWSLPQSRTKNSRPHDVPLSDAAIRIIEALPRIGDAKGLVFTTTGKTPVSGFSRFKALVDRAIQEDSPSCAPQPWTLHDIRRSVATNLQKAGVRLEVTEAILGHTSGSRAGIIGVYQRHDYAAEKRAALAAWSRRLDAIVTGGSAGNIVDLAAQR
jgi:integrase